MKRGTCTVTPVSRVAGFNAFVRVSPLTAGSVETTVSTTDAGSSIEMGVPSCIATCAVALSLRYPFTSAAIEPGTWSWS